MSDEVLGSTVENFASRIRRKLKEQEAERSQSSKAAAERSALILKAMTAVRKALTEASRLSLGDRFRLELDVSDFEGWPRLELKLVDSLALGRTNQALMANANDHSGLGTVQIQLRSGEILGRVHLNDPDEFQRLPLLLKKCMRQFLDLVTYSVLNPERPEDSLEAQTAILDASSLEDSSSSSLSGDVFMSDEDTPSNDNQAELLTDDQAPALSLTLTEKPSPC